jgi:hypothetical protein
MAATATHLDRGSRYWIACGLRKDSTKSSKDLDAVTCKDCKVTVERLKKIYTPQVPDTHVL